MHNFLPMRRLPADRTGTVMEVTAQPVEIGTTREPCWGVTYQSTTGSYWTAWVRTRYDVKPEAGQEVEIWFAKNGGMRGLTVGGKEVFHTSQSDIDRGHASVEEMKIAQGKRATRALAGLDMDQVSAEDPPAITGRLVSYRKPQPGRHGGIDLTDTEGRRRSLPIYRRLQGVCESDPEIVPGAAVKIWVDGNVDDGDLSVLPQRGLQIGERALFYKSEKQSIADRSAIPDSLTIYQPDSGVERQVDGLSL